MQSSALENALRTRVDALVQELSQLIRAEALALVRQALGGAALPAAAPARRKPGRPAGVRNAQAGAQRAGPAKRGRPAAAPSAQLEASMASVLGFVRQNPGQGLEGIGRGLKRDTSGLKPAVAKLLATKQLKTKGKARGTKYFAS
jgi:hypothetical protein